MISYEKYENKIVKVAKFKKFVVRFKFLFIGIFLAVIAAITGLLIAKGTVSGAVTFSAQTIYYGEEYTVTPASAFLSGTSVEYAAVGSSEWSAEKPVLAGKYRARTVSSKTVGKGHGKESDFEILPRSSEFIITSDSVVYGNAPNGVTLSGLVLGDRLDKSGLTFIYDTYLSDEANVELDLTSLRIINANGEDRTNCYAVETAPKKLSIQSRSILLSPADFRFTYSGAGVAASSLNKISEQTSRALAEGDRVEFTASLKDGAGGVISEAVNAGNYTLEAESFRIMKGEIDVTERYQIATGTSDLFIARKEITVRTGSEEREYNGNTLQNKTVTPEGLIAGHKITATDFAEVTDADSVPNTAKFTLQDAIGNDVTANYEILPQYGTLTVKPFALGITTDGATQVYNGKPLSAQGYTPDRAMLAGYLLCVTDVPELTAAGEMENKLALSVTDSFGNDMNRNFAINYTYGTLTVTHRPITVQTKGAQRVYDGNPLSNTDYELKNASDLLDFQSIRAGKIYSVTNVGSEQNTTQFLIYENGTDVTANYRITYEYGTLTVTPRPIVITTATSSQVYNAEVFSDASYTTAYGTEEGLLGGDTLNVLDYQKLTNVGSTPNECVYSLPNGNYEIADIVYGTLTVTPRPIVIKTANSSHVYDATEFSDSSYETTYGTESGLLNGDELTVQSAAKITNAGSVTNECLYSLPNGNYAIADYRYGTLTVTPRPIVVTTANETKVYDGVSLTNVGKEYSTYFESDSAKAGLLNGDELIIGECAEITAAGSTANSFVYTLPNGNYTVAKEEWGTLLIKKRPLLVYTASDEKYYDGKPLENRTYEKVEYNGDSTLPALIGDDTLVIYGEPTSITDAGSTLNQTEFTASSSNYSVEGYVYGTLTVKPRPLTVTTATSSHVYDAIAYSDANYTTHFYGDESKEGLLNGDELVLKTFVAIVDKGSLLNECEFTPPNGNYEIKEVVHGTLTVTARPITVSSATSSHVYDAKPYSDKKYTTHYFGDENKEGLLNGDELTVVTFAEITDKGSCVNVCTYTLPSGNYEIKEQINGTLTVSARPIVITTATNSHVYDATAFSDSSYKTAYGTEAGLLGDDKLTVISKAEITDVGSIRNECVYQLPSENYTAEYEYGTLTVSPRFIKVVTTDDTKPYDGTPLYNYGYTATLFGDENKEGLLNGDTLTVTKYAQITNYGETENKCEYTVPVGVYGNDNYKIEETEYGTLSVSQAEIMVQLLAREVVYGEENYPTGANNYLNFESAGLVNGETLQVAVLFDGKAQVKNAGTYIVTLDEANSIVYDSEGNAIKNGVNNYNISCAESSLTIKRREITLRLYDDTVEYGDTNYYPHTGYNNFQNAETCGLQYGEQVIVRVGTYRTGGETYFLASELLSVGKYEIVVISYEWYGFDEENGIFANGELAKNYKISFGGYLEVVPREIVITPLPVEATYGDQFTYPAGVGNYDISGTLAYSDTLEIFVTFDCGEEPDVGKYDITAVEEKTLVNGKPDTSNYNITYKKGELAIRQREITLELFDLENVPYGQTPTYPAGKNNFKNADNIDAAYHQEFEVTVRYTVSGVIVSPKDARQYGYRYNDFTVYDKDGNVKENGAGNYIIFYEFKTVEITPLELTIEVDEQSCVYGEAEDLQWKFTLASPAYNETISYHTIYISESGVLGMPKYAGDYKIAVVTESIAVTEEDGGKGNTNNYVFTTGTGNLTIEKRDITVEFYDVTVEYGDTDFYPYVGWNNFKNADTCDLQYGEKLSVAIYTYCAVPSSAEDRVVPKNVGNYRSVDIDILWGDSDGSLQEFVYLTDNYNVTIKGGNLEIVPLEVQVQVGELSISYGDEIEEFAIQVTPDLAYGEELSVTVVYFQNGEQVTPKNVGEYEAQILHEETRINGSSEGVKNYSFTYIEGTLTVSPRSVGIKLSDVTAVYGEAFSYPNGVNNYILKSGNLAYDDTLEVAAALKETLEKYPVGEHEIVFDNEHSLLNGKNDFSNYLISCESGTFTVTQKEVTVVLSAVENAVYGETFVYPNGIGNYASAEGLLDGEQLEISAQYFKDGKTTVPKYVGEYAVGLQSATVYDGDGNEIVNGANNYNLLCEEITAEITPLEVTVTFGHTAYVYGEIDGDFTIKLSHTATAYFDTLHGRIGFKFNGVWTSERPKDVGNYEIFVPENGFEVLDDYNDEVTENYTFIFIYDDGILEITPRPITIITNSDIKPYDGTPLVNSGYTTHYFGDETKEGLVYGETLNIIESAEITDCGTALNTFVYELPNANYVVAEEQWGTLEITKRKIVVTTADDSKVYDGTPLINTNYTATLWNDASKEGMLDGDTLTVLTYTEITNKGTTPNNCTYEAPQNYEIVEVKPGTLEILVRTVYVESASASKPYDGTPLSAPSANIAYYVNEQGEKEDALVLTHEFVMGDYPEITDVGVIDNICIASVYDPEHPEEDVNSNYRIVSSGNGKLEVTPRLISVVTNSGKKPYDGTALYDYGYTATLFGGTEDGLLNGDTLTVTKYAQITNYGSIANECEYTVPVGIYGNGNYKIEDIEYGTLSIEKVAITITLHSREVIYGEESYPAGANNYVNYQTAGLVNGETLQVAVLFDGKTQVKNVGTYIVTLDEANSVVYDKYGNAIENGIENYGITCDEASLKISPREISIEAFDLLQYVYGDECSYPTGAGNFKYALTCGLQYGEQLEIFVRYESVEGAVFPNAGQYRIVINQAETLLNGETEGLSNYIIVYTDGELIIAPRPITVVTGDASRYYDGSPLSNPTYTTHLYGNVRGEGLLNGDTLTIVSYADITDKGTVPNECTFEEIESGNYEIKNVIYGTLEVLARPITVELYGLDSVIYGETFAYPAYQTGTKGNFANANECDLVSGETLQVAVKYYLNGIAVTPKNAGIYTVRFDLAGSTVTRNGELMDTSNYEITCAEKRAEIAKRNLEISISDMGEVVYSGSPYYYPANNYTILNGDFAYGESLLVGVFYYASKAPAVSAQPVNADTYMLEFNPSGSRIGGMDATVNYNVTCGETHTLIILPKEITLKLSAVTHVYNGEVYNFENAPDSAFAVAGLCGDDKVKRTVSYSSEPLNAGEYTITYESGLFELERGLTSNYILNAEDSTLACTLTVTPREITVTVNDREIERTGYAVDPADESFTSQRNGGDGFVKGDETKVTATYRYNGSLTPPSEIGTYTVTVALAEDDVTKNYQITYESGTLSITGRIVIVTPVYTGGEYTYNGQAVDVGLFGFTSRHAGENLPEGDRYGFEEGDIAGITAVFTFTGAGATYTDGATPVNAGTYKVSVALSGYDNVNYLVRYDTPVTFTILPRPLSASVTDIEMLYRNHAPEETPEITVTGILEQDKDNYSFAPLYLNANGNQLVRYNAGTYDIGVQIISADGLQNYVIETCEKGTLVINQAKLYVKPVSKSGLYTGSNITIGVKEYIVFDGDGLAEGDYLFIEADGELNPEKSFALMVGVKRAWVRNRDSANGNYGSDVTENYLIYTSQNIDANASYRINDYKSQLTAVQRTLYFEQYVPNGQKVFVYSGEKPVIDTGNPSALFRNVTASYGGTGLLSGHRLEFGGISVGKAVACYKDWLKLKVYDEQGNDVTKAYKLTCVNKEEENISVIAIDVSLTVQSSVTLESLRSGAALTTSFDGKTVLKQSLYTAKGLLAEHSVEIVVSEGSEGSFTFYVLLYEPKLTGTEVTGRRDKSMYYALNSKLPDGLNVNVELISTFELENQ